MENVKLVINIADEELMSLPVERMSAIGKAGADALKRNGVSTFGELCNYLWTGADLSEFRTVGVKGKRKIQCSIIETVMSRKSDAELEQYAEVLKRINEGGD